MIRIQEIPIKSAKSIQASRPVRQHRIRPSQGPKSATTIRVRPLASAPVAA
jgi:hypothetical protein